MKKKKKGEWYGKGVQRKEWYKDKKKKRILLERELREEAQTRWK